MSGTGRIFTISKTNDGVLDCRVSNKAFEENMADICRFKPVMAGAAMSMTPDMGPQSPAPMMG